MDTASGQDPHLELAYLPPAAGWDRRVELDRHDSSNRMKQYLRPHLPDFVDGCVYDNE